MSAKKERRLQFFLKPRNAKDSSGDDGGAAIPPTPLPAPTREAIPAEYAYSDGENSIDKITLRRLQIMPMTKQMSNKTHLALQACIGEWDVMLTQLYMMLTSHTYTMKVSVISKFVSKSIDIIDLIRKEKDSGLAKMSGQPLSINSLCTLDKLRAIMDEVLMVDTKTIAETAVCEHMDDIMAQDPLHGDDWVSLLMGALSVSLAPSRQLAIHYAQQAETQMSAMTLKDLSAHESISEATFERVIKAKPPIMDVIMLRKLFISMMERELVGLCDFDDGDDVTEDDADAPPALRRRQKLQRMHSSAKINPFIADDFVNHVVIQDDDVAERINAARRVDSSEIATAEDDYTEDDSFPRRGALMREKSRDDFGLNFGRTPFYDTGPSHNSRRRPRSHHGD